MVVGRDGTIWVNYEGVGAHEREQGAKVCELLWKGLQIVALSNGLQLRLGGPMPSQTHNGQPMTPDPAEMI